MVVMKPFSATYGGIIYTKTIWCGSMVYIIIYAYTDAQEVVFPSSDKAPCASV